MRPTFRRARFVCLGIAEVCSRASIADSFCCQRVDAVQRGGVPTLGSDRMRMTHWDHCIIEQTPGEVFLINAQEERMLRLDSAD